MKLKYVMFDGFFPVMFTGGIGHKEVTAGDRKPTSAGFVKFLSSGDVVSAAVYGESESLGLKPHKDDAEIIENFCTKGGLR